MQCCCGGETKDNSSINKKFVGNLLSVKFVIE